VLKKRKAKILFVSILASITFITTSSIFIYTGATSENIERASNEIEKCEDNEIDCFTKWFRIIDNYESMPGVVANLKQLIKTRSKNWDCHTISHHIGEDMYLRNGKNSFQTGGEDLCASGLYDGMFTGLGKRESLKNLYAIAIELCNTVKISQYSCLHGLGHSASVSSNGNIKESLKICDLIQEELTARNCGLGVLMQMDPRSLGIETPCLGKESPALSGCANIFSIILVRNNIPIDIGCAPHIGYVKEDCEYGYGWWASSTYHKNGNTAENICKDSLWCSRGWGWGSIISRPSAAIEECRESYEIGSKLHSSCILGTTQDFLHDSVLPDRPGPLKSADASIKAPSIEDLSQTGK